MDTLTPPASDFSSSGPSGETGDLRAAARRRLAPGGGAAGAQVLILGGGVNGVATFRELALNGVPCVLIDTGDFCRGATSASSRMAHGGLRYLEGREFRLVAEAARERNRLIALAPHLVRPLEIVVPLDHLLRGFGRAAARFLGLSRRPGPLSLAALEGALRLYEAYGRREHPLPDHRTRLSRAAFPPGLPARTRAVVSYFDGQIVEPEGLVMEMIGEALAAGPHAAALNHVQWRRAGPQIEILEEGETLARIAPRLVVNATGAWIDRVNAALGAGTAYLRGVKGAHLVLDAPALHARMAGRAFYFDDGTGRMVITLPVGENVLVGTTEVETAEPEDRAVAGAEIDYLLRAIDGLFEDIAVTREQIVGLTSGIRPLRRGAGGASATAAARDHALEEDVIGALPVLSLVGGKWTTFRAFGEQAADRALALLGRPRRVSTAARPFPGAAPCDPARLAAAHGLDPALAARLVARRGALAAEVAPFCRGAGAAPLPGAPQWCAGEIDHAILRRGAFRLEDIVLRRTDLARGAGLRPETLAALAARLVAAGRPAEAVAAEAAALAADPRLMSAGLQGAIAAPEPVSSAPVPSAPGSSGPALPETAR